MQSICKESWRCLGQGERSEWERKASPSDRKVTRRELTWQSIATYAAVGL